MRLGKSAAVAAVSLVAMAGGGGVAYAATCPGMGSTSTTGSTTTATTTTPTTTATTTSTSDARRHDRRHEVRHLTRQ